MAAAKLELVTGTDGGVHLIGKVDGCTLEFAHVNASQVAAARVAQGLEPWSPDPAPGSSAATDDASDSDDTADEG